MLVIRAEQVRTLERNRRVSFEQALGKHLEAKLRGHGGTLDAELIGRVVARGLGQASRFGLSTEAQVARFVEIILLQLPGFEEELPKQALAILLSYGMDPKEKLDRFERWAQGLAGRKAVVHGVL